MASVAFVCRCQKEVRRTGRLTSCFPTLPTPLLSITSHIHLRQAEYFQVVQGVLGVVQNGKEVALTKEDGPVGIPAGVRCVREEAAPSVADVASGDWSTNADRRSPTTTLRLRTLPYSTSVNRHAFWCHESCSEDLIFKVWLTPENLDHGLDEKFMRNFDGYLVDCEKAKVAPSLFQLLLFLYDADIVLTPPFWVPLFFLKSVHHVLAHWVGHRLLGYQTSYPEYYVASKKAS